MLILTWIFLIIDNLLVYYSINVFIISLNANMQITTLKSIVWNCKRQQSLTFVDKCLLSSTRSCSYWKVLANVDKLLKTSTLTCQHHLWEISDIALYTCQHHHVNSSHNDNVHNFRILFLVNYITTAWS